MTASTQLKKTLLAGVATVALVGTAFAQGTPPTTASPNAATGAGQQSSQGTSMGTTGVGGGGTGNTGAATGAATTPPPAAATSVDTTRPANSGATSRPMRADRN